MDNLKVISLFTGAGGLDYGFHNHPLFEIIFANDFMKEACETYRHNFKGSDNYLVEGDISSYISGLPHCDILIGGFPCPTFSLAGKREGFDDPEGVGLQYLSCCKALTVSRPKMFIFENVKGILSHDKGSTVKTVVSAFKARGYNCAYKLINMSDYNTPQNRERVLFIGIRGDLSYDPLSLFPDTVPRHKPFLIKDILGEHNKIFPKLPCNKEALYPNHNYHIGDGKTKPYWMRVVCNPGENLSKISYEEIRKRQLKMLNDEGLELITQIPKSNMGYRRLDDQKIAPTMMFGNTCLPIHPYEHRSISVREAAYLQGFPLYFKFMGGLAAQYKQVGNAVPPTFSTILVKHLAGVFGS